MSLITQKQPGWGRHSVHRVQGTPRVGSSRRGQSPAPHNLQLHLCTCTFVVHPRVHLFLLTWIAKIKFPHFHSFAISPLTLEELCMTIKAGSCLQNLGSDENSVPGQLNEALSSGEPKPIISNIGNYWLRVTT